MRVLGTGVGVTSGWNGKASADIGAETRRSGSRPGVVCLWRKVLWGGVCGIFQEEWTAFPLRGSEAGGAPRLLGPL